MCLLFWETWEACSHIPKSNKWDALTVSLNQFDIFHSRKKHIAIDYHLAQIHMSIGCFAVSYISSNDQLVDAIIKPLSTAKFLTLLSKNEMSNRCFILRVPVKDNANVNIISIVNL